MTALKLLGIFKSDKPNKKYKAEFNDGSHTYFGSAGYEDYTTHKDIERKRRYIMRHKNNENWNDPKTAGALSRYILWNKETLKASIKDYKQRFGL